MSSSPEKIGFGFEQERNPEVLKQTATERHEAIREKLDKASESPENAEAARHEALERAISIDHERRQEVDRQPSPAERRKDGPISKARRDASFQSTMSEVQPQMSAPSRVFSKVIHNKVIEQASDMAAGTIARPNALLSGAVLAFVLTLTVYLVAKNLGYPLSGFETIGAFILGWVLGIVYDFLRVMITGRK